MEPLVLFSRFVAQTTRFRTRRVFSELGRWMTSF